MRSIATHTARLAPIRPVATLRTAVARRLTEALLARVPVQVHLPAGQILGGGDANAPRLNLVRPESLYRRLGEHPKIGLGEAYMEGDWTAGEGTDLADALAPFASQLESLLPKPVVSLRRLADSALPQHHRGTPENAAVNVSAHYDLSNELFTAFLDPSMTYSSALFVGPEPLPEQDLQQAQWRKIDRALDAAGVGEGTSLLEIGTGWGELALRAAERGARVISITLSAEQQHLAQERIAAAGLADRVEVRLQDYRAVTGQFDAIVSIEMIEAVGDEFWPDFFATIDNRLVPGGRAVIQAILMDHHRYLATRHSHGWIQEYIFPGGLIPSLAAIDGVLARHTTLQRAETFAFGRHYAETLRRWRASFTDAWGSIASEQFDERFRRMWEFYLAYCEAGFRTGYLDVAQLTLRRI